ncbi:hypothetical protein Dred_0088 [Desulforamulus reducens MI-1]|uniref:Uncharacterized protein n=1 Tax=Desulforamulus reducens (strain ATCC BAA-1160 / DSM 100696 / MI-1) TaxID=349161 RepID=A4J0N5_DESRM|nr:hypothetical protein [Desulforamulus reducens]ABO48638.1 hypothetical protein Dred_0088 [Desulforamulus reducens MI-1]
MEEKSSNRLASNLEQLVSRMESIHFQRSSELDQVSGVLGNMDKLVDVLSRVELQRQAEHQLIDQVNRLNEVVESLSGQETVSKREVPVEDTLRKVIKGVKVTGKVMDIVAGSLGVMFDSIVATVKVPERQNTTRSSKEQVDLASVLAPLGGILQGLLGTESVENSQSNRQAKPDEKKEE